MQHADLSRGSLAESAGLSRMSLAESTHLDLRKNGPKHLYSCSHRLRPLIRVAAGMPTTGADEGPWPINFRGTNHALYFLLRGEI